MVEDANPALYACWSYAIAGLVFGLVLIFIKSKKTSTKNTKFPKKVYLFGGMQAPFALV